MLKSFLWEAASIGLLGSVLGCAVGTALSYRMVKTTMRMSGGFDVDFLLPPQALVLTVAAAVALCVLAAFVTLSALPGIGRADAAEDLAA